MAKFTSPSYQRALKPTTLVVIGAASTLKLNMASANNKTAKCNTPMSALLDCVAFVE